VKDSVRKRVKNSKAPSKGLQGGNIPFSLGTAKSRKIDNQHQRNAKRAHRRSVPDLWRPVPTKKTGLPWVRQGKGKKKNARDPVKRQSYKKRVYREGEK